jgi:hypothetical protein
MYTPDKIEQELLCAVANKKKDVIIFCGYTTIDKNNSVIKSYRLPDYITRVIPLKLPISSLEKGLSKSRSVGIRKAVKNGLSFRNRIPLITSIRP